MAVYQKILWIVAAALLVGLGFWLGLVMPSQGWAQWDGKRWQVVAESWAVLWRGWPLAAFGALVGSSAAWVGLAFALKHAKEADFRAKIARLTRQRDAAVDEAEARVRSAGAGRARPGSGGPGRATRGGTRHGRGASRPPAGGAGPARRRRAVSQATLRARNAICAAERIKRRVEGKKRLEIETSAP